ncbi:TBC1 domain family member 13-like isoform X1 [Biomphalaria glabrata]|uniref:TBC1 domain family member 13 n=2 Tax=Biomphalaria TaxID=6525 RepID=A0A2C9JLU8_BIOGL|nr:TBC1 domain family member 13-like [Biomphalaria glabrata]KAI8748635.1 TBC1 domain family member 13-like isoform X1 [Biomphalaria glabrata]KAI8770955.1 TBC1 domain family member 13 isoform X1 [Biomphalaria glabrata]KAK0065668.1 TBC1 domain family member 13-like isoform X1 [Biomphalaria pfeifferi]
MAGYQQRLKCFEDLLEADVIDLKALRNLCFISGCPHEKSIRSICWKIFLNYIPLEKRKWNDVLQKQRNLYKQYIEEIIILPGKKMKSKESANGELEDHPLNPNPDSEWRETFRDNEMLLQIDKDCRRLCPDLSFFQQATEYPCEVLINSSSSVENLRKRVEQCVLQSETVAKNRLGITLNVVSKKRTHSDEYSVLPDGKEAHWEVVERILFLYAKLNPGLNYVQGMNEILGPIYYTFATDPDQNYREHAEADSFFCFTCLMSEIRDFFIKTLDDSQFGIGSKMNQLMEMLKELDRPLWQRLQDQELRPQFYAFRWITLLLSQEFQLPDVLRIWDSLFADSHRFEFLIYICCAILISVRQDILKNDFPSNMKLVQRVESEIDLRQVLAKARELSST